MADYQELREQREHIKRREAALYDWRESLEEEKRAEEEAEVEATEKEENKDKKGGKHPFVKVMPEKKDGLKEAKDDAKKDYKNWSASGVYTGPDRKNLKLKPDTKLRKEELSIDDQMRISREAAKGRNPKPDHKAIRAKQMKNSKAPKDTRTDAQKMTDATGPRKGSNYRGD